MTDAELEVFLGIAGTKERARIIAEITPEQRAQYNHMHQVELDLKLWLAGVGPKPKGVIVCRVR